MLRHRLTVWIGAVCLASISAGASAQVSASLVAGETALSPGAIATVALKLEHQSPWHTYWKYAGTGFPTSLKWELPQGWSIGEIDWPVPTLIQDANGRTTGHGYTGIVLLPMELDVPKNAAVGQSVTLKAQVRWLMCAQECVPKTAELTLTLPIARAVKPNDGIRKALSAQAMPVAMPKAWSPGVSRQGAGVVLNVAADLKNPHFYMEEPLFDYEAPQTVSSKPGQTAVQITPAKGADLAGKHLHGVLAYTDAQGVYRGADVDLPIDATRP